MSLILDLQQECLSQSDTTSLLRKAHLVAFKLDLARFDTWIANEMNGYPNANEVPAYREVAGTLKAKAPEFVGGIVVNLSKQPMLVPLATPISSIEALLNDSSDDIRMAPSRKALDALVKDYPNLRGSNLFLSIAKAELQKISEGIKNKILQWSLELEKAGIVGDGLSFTGEEKKAAKNLAGTGLFVEIYGDLNGNLQIQQEASNSDQSEEHRGD